MYHHDAVQGQIPATSDQMCIEVDLDTANSTRINLTIPSASDMEIDGYHHRLLMLSSARSVGAMSITVQWAFLVIIVLNTV